MKITVFTSNHPRHLSFIKKLNTISDELNVIIESKTYFSENFIIKDAKEYFFKMKNSETKIFGNIEPLKNNGKTIFLNMGDLSKLNLNIIDFALNSDIYIVFGCGYIKGDLCDYLIQKKAVNIHMGVSPFFRGAACNFWALYDNFPEYVGATIHYISKGLDSGPVIFHSVIEGKVSNLFDYGMLAVEGAQNNLIKEIVSNNIFKLKTKKYDKHKEIRYSRKKDFSEEIITKFLKDPISLDIISKKIKNRDISHLHNLRVFKI